MKTPVVVILSVATLLFGAAAANGQAQSGRKSPSSVEATFKSLDRNRDAALSKVEAKADKSIAAVFDSADINLDGYITKSEYTAYLQRSAESQPQR